MNAQYDIIFDTVGKSSFSRSKKVLAKKGVYLSPVLKFSLLLQMMLTSLFGEKKAIFEATGANKEDTLKGLLEDLVKIHNKGQLKIIIDRQYPLERVPQAYQYISCGHKKGNVVIVNAA